MKHRRLGACLLGTSASLLVLVSAAPAFAQSVASGDSGTIETVVVTGRLQAEKVKQDAPNVLDIRPETEIQKLPDVTLAEALQRVPGVSMESDSGEGRFVNIRGMDADLNGTTFDGVRLTASNASTPQGGGRAVAFDAFPSGIVGGVEVIKSLTPDIDAEGLGGVVNIVPKTMAAGTDELLDLSLGSGTETLRGSPVWDGQITAGYRFGPSDNITAVVSYEYHEDWRGIDDIENGGAFSNFPGNLDPDLELRWYKYHRRRQGVAGSVSWDVDSDTTLFVRGFYAGYTEYAHKHRLEIDNLDTESSGAAPTLGAGEYVVDDAAPLQDYTDSKEHVANKLAEFGGHTTFGGNILGDFRVSWTEGDDHSPWSYGFKFSDPNPVLFEYNDTTDPNHPSIQTLDGTNLADPANYTKGKLSDSSSLNQDQEVGGVADFTVPLSFGDVDGSLKFGGSIRARIRRAFGTQQLTSTKTGSLAGFVEGKDQIYYDGLYDIGPMADLDALAAIPEAPLVIDPSTQEHDNENVYAGYIQYSATIGKLSLLGGVRIESTDANYNANIVDGDDNLIGPSTNKQSYTNVFPDINAKYQLTDELLLRAAFTTSIARPGFNQITAAKTFDFSNDVISQGNPNVKATTADNFDLTAEYYLPEGGLASGGLFYKSFSNYIVPTVAVIAAPNPNFTAPTVQLDSFSDIGAAHALGFELNYVQQFTFLPDPLDGLGFDGNFTYIDTRGQIRVGEEHALPQTSPRNFNAELFYEKEPVSLRIAASYVSTNLWQVGGDDTTDLYSQARFRLDFGGSYKFDDTFEGYVDVKNITNTKLEFTQTPSTAYPVQREFYNPDIFFGIRAHF